MNNVITLTLNPCFDVTIFTDSLDDDKVSLVTSEIRETGGKGINVSKLLHTLDIPVKTYGMLGDMGKFEFLRLLGDEAGETHFTDVPGNVRENIIIRTDDKTYKINRQGADYVISDCFTLIEKMIKTIKKDDIVCICGRKPNGITNEDFVNITKHFKAAGARVAVDCDFLNLEEMLEIKPWLIKPNNHELEHLLKAKFETREEIIKASEDLCRQGIENVLISMGGNGLAGVKVDETIYVKALKVELKSTIGAGDSALAGFIAGELTGKSFDEKVHFAAACGTAAVMYEGTVSPPIETIEKVFAEISK